MVATEAKVHALLKTGTLALAHLDVRNDVVAHRVFLDAELEVVILLDAGFCVDIQYEYTCTGNIPTKTSGYCMGTFTNRPDNSVNANGAGRLKKRLLELFSGRIHRQRYSAAVG